MRWKDALGHLVVLSSGQKLGILKNMYLSTKGGMITWLEVASPQPWILLKGELFSGPILVSTMMARPRGDVIVVSEEFQPDTGISTAKGLPRIGSLIKAEVFAGRGWRVGSLVDVQIDLDSWTVVGLDIDTYPEYLISSGRHTIMLPKGFPPVCRVRVRGDRVEFHPADPIGKSFNVILTMKGKDLEDSIENLLLGIGNEVLSEEQQAELVQEAFDMAYRKGT